MCFHKNILRKVLVLSVSCCFLAGCTHKDLDWCSIREHNLEHDLKVIYCDANLPERPLELEDILKVAFERNIDLLVKERELEVQREIATRDRYKMLPSLTIGAEAGSRSEPFVETSRSVVTGIESPGSISRERTTKRFDLSLAWNLLDFGVSYFRSRQEKNRSLMVCLDFQRARQNLIYNIISEYWKAVVAMRALESATSLFVKAEERQEDIDDQISKKLVSEIEGLRNKDRLVAIQIQLQSYEREFQSAKRQLSSLMGLPPSTKFELAKVEKFKTPKKFDDIRKLEEMALLSRPELYSQDIQENIMCDEVRVAILEMFPNATLFVERDYDGDRFLVHNNWYEAGIKATWDLLHIHEFTHNKKRAIKQKKLVQDQRLSLSIGIMAQVHLANIRFDDAQSQFELSQEQHDIKERLLSAVRKELLQGLISATDLFPYEVDLHFAEIASLEAYAEMQISMEQVNNSIGTPLHFNTYAFNTADPENHKTVSTVPKKRRNPPPDSKVCYTYTFKADIPDEISSTEWSKE